MTFIKKFEALRKKFIGADTTPLESKIAMQVNMTDEDCGGTFYIEADKGMLSVEPYDYYDHTVMITLSAGDFAALADRKESLAELCERGRVMLEGDFSHAEAVFAIVPQKAKKAASKPRAAKKTAEKPEKKTAAKKTAEKKTTAKKSVKKADAKPTAAAKTETAKAETAKAETIKVAAVKTPSSKKSEK